MTLTLNLALLSNCTTVKVPRMLELGAKPNADTLNAALLSNCPTVMVQKMLQLGAKPNEDTLNAAHSSEIPSVMVPRMQRLGAQPNDNPKIKSNSYLIDCLKNKIFERDKIRYEISSELTFLEWKI